MNVIPVYQKPQLEKVVERHFDRSEGGNFIAHDYDDEVREFTVEQNEDGDVVCKMTCCKWDIFHKEPYARKFLHLEERLRLSGLLGPCGELVVHYTTYRMAVKKKRIKRLSYS